MSEHSSFTIDGTRELNFHMESSEIRKWRTQWQQFARSIAKNRKPMFNGKGIVMCAGGLKYFTCAWVSINLLRKLGCQLPIELWSIENELTISVKQQLKKLNVTCRTFDNVDVKDLFGYALKPLAIIRSHFEEVLFIDADNCCVRDPAYLFNNSKYMETGALFWPDYWQTAKDNPIFKIIKTKAYKTPEQESGQLLINKSRYWTELNLCLYFNKNHLIYHKLLLGDKDTFKFAWKALCSSFYMIRRPAGSCGFLDANGNFVGNTMVQHDPAGEILFLHRNLQKWDCSDVFKKNWKLIRTFKPKAENRNFVFDYHESEHTLYINLTGDVVQVC